LQKLLFSLRISQELLLMSLNRLYEFGPFRLDAGGRLLFREGQRLALSPKAVELLVVLVEAEANTVGKEELLNRVWADTAVEEGSLTSHISLLRKTLGERYIETIPKRGYRFVGTVKQVAEASERQPHIRSLAVLPLENLSPDPDGDYFADSMTVALITGLAKITSLRVVSRTSIMRYKNTQKSLPEIGKELSVDAIVEGSVQREGDRVRISARLVRAATDQHMWADAYDRELRDVLILQNEVARTIAQQVQAKLTPEEHARLSSAREVDPGAYELAIKGRYFWVKRTEDSINRALALFQQAVERDPGYAAAYSGLADCYSSLGFSFDVGSQRPAEVQPKAKAAAMKALELDDSLADAYTSLAYVKLNFDWDWPGAEVEFKRSLQLNPAYANGHHWRAHLLLSSGRLSEALAESKRALELDVLSPIMNVHLGWHYLYARQYDRALDQLTKTLELDPNYGLAHWYRGLAYQQKGMYTEALRELAKARNLLKHTPIVEADIGHLHAVSGSKTEAESVIAWLKKESARRYVNPFAIALIYVGLGRNDQGFEWLDTAFRERSDMLVYLRVDPRLDSIRPDPRFALLVGRVGVPHLSIDRE
jgi:TolB-like protein/Tfp pilus assembly protein PilF